MPIVLTTNHFFLNFVVFYVEFYKVPIELSKKYFLCQKNKQQLPSRSR